MQKKWEKGTLFKLPKEALDKLGLQYATIDSIKEGVIEQACNWNARRK